MKSILVISFYILLVSCSDEPEEYCYECHSKMMPISVWCGYQEAEMENVIDWREYWLNDTMKCELKEYEP